MGPIGKSSVTVLVAPLITAGYGRRVRDWDHAVSTALSGVTVDMDRASRNRDGKDQAVTQATAFLPRGATVPEGARVVWAGRTWEVDGAPADPEGAGPLGGAVVRLLEVAG